MDVARLADWYGTWRDRQWLAVGPRVGLEPLIGWIIESHGQTSLGFGGVAMACLTGALLSPFIKR